MKLEEISAQDKTNSIVKIEIKFIRNFTWIF
jgi:hypothetical protein